MKLLTFINLVADCSRRDFTINAMALDAKFRTTLVDPFGGQKDLSDGVIRHVSNAFKDDPLRVLRAARFAARYGFSIAPETVEAIHQVPFKDLDAISHERILIEIRKTIKDGKLFRFLEILNELNKRWIIEKIFGVDYTTSNGIRCDYARVEGTIICLMIETLRLGGRLPDDVNELKSHRSYAEHFYAFEQKNRTANALCDLISFLGKHSSVKAQEFFEGLDVLHAPFRRDDYFFNAMEAYWAINADSAWSINPSLEGKELGDLIKELRLKEMEKFV